MKSGYGEYSSITGPGLTKRLWPKMRLHTNRRPIRQWRSPSNSSLTSVNCWRDAALANP
jgi:hypothetical protein